MENETKNGMTFEEAMGSLESISARLSGENVPLDEAIALYEKGIEYYDICKRKLDDANRRVRVIEEGLKNSAGPGKNKEGKDDYGEENGKDGGPWV